MHAYTVNGGTVSTFTSDAGDGFRLALPACDGTHYCDAQLDDYGAILPFVFAQRAPARLDVWARFSHPIGVLQGTAGFGFWNHPFGSAGATIPRAAWFFHASAQNKLQFVRGSMGNGLTAGMLDAFPQRLGWAAQRSQIQEPTPQAPWHITTHTDIDTRIAAAREVSKPTRLLFRAALAVTRFRPLMALAIRVAQAVFRAHETPLLIDITEWHRYTLSWQHQHLSWHVDGTCVAQSNFAPAGPLGLVIWIDNYRARFTDAGTFAFDTLPCPAQWLELRPA